MIRYLLDANAVIALLNEPTGTVAHRTRQHKPGDIGLSVIVAHELYYGAFRSQRRDSNVALIDGLQFEIADFDPEDAREAGQIRAALAARGTPIGPYDVLIAGQAKARGLILITANVGEFGRVVGLQVEDWSQPWEQRG